MRSKSLRILLGSLVSGSLLFSGAAIAQEAPPPVDVPTTPVNLDPNPIVPGAPPPKSEPPPKAAPAPAPEPKSEGKAEDKDKDKGDKKPGTKVNNEGYFKVSGGKGTWVGSSGPSTKGGGKAAPAPAKAKGGKAPVVAKATPTKKPITVAQWVGFHVTDDGGSEVMLEFTTDISAPSEHKAAGTLTYVFKGAHIIKANNRNPLITVHWNTPVARARMEQKGGEVHLIIEMRPGVSVSATTGIRPGGDGDGQQFFAKFGAGSYLPVATDDEASADGTKAKDKDAAKDKAKPKDAPKDGGGAKAKDAAPAKDKAPAGGAAGPKE